MPSHRAVVPALYAGILHASNSPPMALRDWNVLSCRETLCCTDSNAEMIFFRQWKLFRKSYPLSRFVVQTDFLSVPSRGNPSASALTMSWYASWPHRNEVQENSNRNPFLIHCIEYMHASDINFAFAA